MPLASVGAAQVCCSRIVLGAAKSAGPEPKRILTIDGGGLKGALPAALLAAVEDSSGKRIVDQFDLIAGTSTGAIIALGLGMGLGANEILEFYRERGPSIFGQRQGTAAGVGDWLQRAGWQFGARMRGVIRNKYSNRELARALTDIFSDSQLGDAATRLVIPA